MDKEFILYGASGHAKVIVDAMELNNFEKIRLIDDNDEIRCLGRYDVSHKLEMNNRVQVLVSIGKNAIRKRIVESVESVYFSVVHPKAILASTVSIGSGTFVAAGVVINSDTRIANHVIINTCASIDHDCTIANFSHIAPNTTLCGGISIGEGTLIGAGAIILPNINIGNWVTVGAGAVISKDIEDGKIVVGNNRIIEK